MCGISGIVAPDQPEFPLWLEEMTRRQAHRGNDHHGFSYWNSIGETGTSNINAPILGLAHQRLAIQDLSEAGNQPFFDPSKRFSIVYNGEVYNFKMLREELLQRGVQFYSGTDTEVVLQAYITWGESCLQRFNGMFAFAIWDNQTKELFLARDRFGVKPLYFYKTKAVFVFSSEMKTLGAIPQFQRRINPIAIHDYLINAEAERNGLCFFEEITELLPGHCAVFKLDTFSLNVNQWYHISAVSNDETDQGKVASNVKELVDGSIKERLIADVPVGACLSGGLDSSIIVSSMLNDQVKPFAFTATFDGFDRDESQYAREFENEVNWLKTSPSATDFRNEIEKVVWTHDIPFFSASTFIQYKVMQLVSDTGIKVTLDGQGADELFAGYARHYGAYFNECIRKGAVSEAFELFSKANPYFCNKKQLIKEFAKQFVNKPVDASIYSKDLLAASVQGRSPSPKTLNETLRNEVLGTTLKNLLRTGDRNSMAHTVEARMPFADSHQLTEYALNIHPRLKIGKGLGKAILRKAYAHQVPESIINRRDKIGFEAPQSKWMRELKPFIRSVFPIHDDEYVQWSKLQSTFDNYFDDQVNGSKLELWRLLNFQLWRQQWEA